MTRRVLILGGTAEARQLAEALIRRYAVTTALAGRTDDPHHPPGDLRVGGFGGADGLAGWLVEHRIDVVLDATHPFAATITAHAVAAARATGVPLLLVRRPPWHAEPGDDWHRADSLADAATALPALGRRVFLTTGRTDLALCTALPDLWFLLRSIDPPDHAPANVTFVRGTGPFTRASEQALIEAHRIEVLVSRDSGGSRAKLDAARALGRPVLLLNRPPAPDGVPVVTTVDDAIAWLP